MISAIAGVWNDATCRRLPMMDRRFIERLSGRKAAFSEGFEEFFPDDLRASQERGASDPPYIYE